jgi:RNA polymerase subunit RPABC4/transcription elongation factor Spt4
MPTKYCRHVYELVRAPICPECGKDTHETDWKVVAEQRRQWIADGKADAVICPDCGGTIRNWWSI